MFACAWSPGGRQLAFSRGYRKTDVVMMSNFRWLSLAFNKSRLAGCAEWVNPTGRLSQ
jgi:hypothetical protein